MKTILKIFSHSLFILVIWILASMISLTLFNVNFNDEGNESALLLMWMACLLNATILHLYLTRTDLTGWRKFLTTSGLMFGVQFFLSQVESWYFIDPEIMTKPQILSVAFSGLLLSIAYGLLTLFTYKSCVTPKLYEWKEHRSLVINVLILIVIAYPLLYFTFGYYVAWQSEAVRIYYSDSAQLDSFWTMMKRNVFESKLYLFQIARGPIWLGLGYIFLSSYNGSRSHAALILGGLFAILMNAQHLIPNTIMPDTVRAFHAVETASSNFIWGVLVTVLLTRGK